jgi:hypothetical protein
MQHRKGSKLRKPRKKHAKRKQSKPRAKARGSASGARKPTKTKKRPSSKKSKKTTKKTAKKKSRTQVKRRGGGRAAGIVDSLRGYYDDARQQLGQFYDKHQDALRTAGKVGLGTLAAAGLGYGLHQANEYLDNSPAYQRYKEQQRLQKLRDADERAVINMLTELKGMGRH